MATTGAALFRMGQDSSLCGPPTDRLVVIEKKNSMWQAFAHQVDYIVATKKYEEQKALGWVSPS